MVVVGEERTEGKGKGGKVGENGGCVGTSADDLLPCRTPDFSGVRSEGNGTAVCMWSHGCFCDPASQGKPLGQAQERVGLVAACGE